MLRRILLTSALPSIAAVSAIAVAPAVASAAMVAPRPERMMTNGVWTVPDGPSWVGDQFHGLLDPSWQLRAELDLSLRSTHFVFLRLHNGGEVVIDLRVSDRTVDRVGAEAVVADIKPCVMAAFDLYERNHAAA